MGEEGKHVRFCAEDGSGGQIWCVLFNKAEDYACELSGEWPVSLVGRLECQEWQGVKRLQFLVDQIEIDESLRQ